MWGAEPGSARIIIAGTATEVNRFSRCCERNIRIIQANVPSQELSYPTPLPEYHHPRMRVSPILPNLYLGPEPSLDEDFAALQTLKITAILSVQDGEDRPDGGIEAERMAAMGRNIVFTNVPVRDFDRLQLVRRLPDCVAALADLIDAGHTVYVHCSAGINRSPTVVVAYLCRHLGWNLDRSLAHVTAMRVCVPDATVIQKVRWGSAANES